MLVFNVWRLALLISVLVSQEGTYLPQWYRKVLKILNETKREHSNHSYLSLS